MSIIVSKHGKDAQRLERTEIEQEKYLQEYIEENPDSLPLHELKEDIKLLILAREFATGSGPIDALGMDSDGDLYIIETKLYKNADKRKVIAQMLDYGASLWSTDLTDFDDRLDHVVNSRFGMSLGAKLQDLYDISSDTASEIRQKLRQNINEGNFRFVVLMDRMDDRLKDLIRFVNQNSRFDVLGVELDFYKHGDLEILIPNLYGAEVQKEVGRTSFSKRQKWDQEQFFEDAKNRMSAEQLIKLQALCKWSGENADKVFWGTGMKTGSFNVRLYHINSTCAVYTVWSTGEVTFNFLGLTDSPETSSEQVRQLKEVVKCFSSFPIDDDSPRNSVKLPLNEWASRFDEFIGLLEKITSKDVLPLH